MLRTWLSRPTWFEFTDAASTVMVTLRVGRVLGVDQERAVEGIEAPIGAGEVHVVDLPAEMGVAEVEGPFLPLGGSRQGEGNEQGGGEKRLHESLRCGWGGGGQAAMRAASVRASAMAVRTVASSAVVASTVTVRTSPMPRKPMRNVR